MTAPTPCRCAPENVLRPLPIALATSSPERRQKLLARGIAETLEDSKELARRLRVARENRARARPWRRRSPQEAGFATTLEESRKLAERHSAVSRQNIATTLEESKSLAERWRQYTAGSGARTLEEAYALAARLKEPPRAPAPVRQAPPRGSAMLPRTLEESLAFAERHNARADTNIAQTLDESKALAERWRAWTAGSGAATLEEAKALAERLRPGATLRKPGPTIVARGPGAGPGAGSGAGTKPVLPTAPLTFRNALWTRFDPPAGVKITDIAAGAASVTGPGGVLRPRVVWATGTDVETGPALSYAFRVLPDGSFDAKFNVQSAGTLHVAGARDTGQAFLFGGSPAMWKGSAAGDSWDIVQWPGYDRLVDMAIARFSDPTEPGIWWVDDTGFLYQVELSGSGPGATFISSVRASNIARVSIAVDGTLWTVDRDGRVLRGTTMAISGDGFATDVAAAPGGDVYAIGTKRAKDAVTSSGTIPAAGNEIWWWNHFTETWTKVEPGWGVAIDVDDDGTLWVVDENGSVLNRGGRSWGFWELSTRSRPKPTGDDWCQLETDFSAAAAVAQDDPTSLPPLGSAESIKALTAIKDSVTRHALPTLWQEAVDRFIEGGASTLRVGQSFAKPDDTGKHMLLVDYVQDRLPLIVAATLGADAFLLFDVVRTGLLVVPDDQAGKTFPNIVDWFNGLFDKIHDEVNQLFSDAGLPQRFEDVIKYISVGGEVDVFMDLGLGNWSNWTTFYAQVAGHIRGVVPRVKVGCVLSLEGAPGHTNGAWGDYDDAIAQGKENWPLLLNASSDYAGFTSYPPQIPTLDDPNAVDPSIDERFQKMLEIAGDLPVVIEEFGYPTYDNATKGVLESAWLGHAFPSSFYAGDGWAGQKKAIDATFAAWDDAKLSLPLLVWFTLFEEHIEGKGCNLLEIPDPNPNPNPYYSTVACNPCPVPDPNCHPCGLGEGVNALGFGADERAGRFFGSSGLIQSNGEPKSDAGSPPDPERSPWGDVVAQTAALRAPRG